MRYCLPNLVLNEVIILYLWDWRNRLLQIFYCFVYLVDHNVLLLGKEFPSSSLTRLRTDRNVVPKDLAMKAHKENGDKSPSSCNVGE
jgi:hypothetical protein